MSVNASNSGDCATACALNAACTFTVYIPSLYPSSDSCFLENNLGTDYISESGSTAYIYGYTTQLKVPPCSQYVTIPTTEYTSGEFPYTGIPDALDGLTCAQNCVADPTCIFATFMNPAGNNSCFVFNGSPNSATGASDSQYTTYYVREAPAVQ